MFDSNELFAEATRLWDLDRLYSDLARQKGSPLTPAEKVRLRGLLTGCSPQEIAQRLHVSVEGLRVDLSRTIYRYVTALLELSAGVNSRTISRQLEQAKYRRLDLEPDFQNSLPLATGFSVPGGQLPVGSPFYVDRPPIEQECYQEILRPGSLIRIKAPRQTGKSSLLTRILAHAEQQGSRACSHSFQMVDGEDFRDLATFLKRFCAHISQELNLPVRIGDFWENFLGSKMNCKVYFEQYLLREVTQPLVIGLDEVDRIFQYPEVAAEFFGMLRAWNEEARIREVWQRFRLVMAYSTEVKLPLDHSQSPFNVGLQLVIPDFQPDKTWELVRRYGLTWHAYHIEQLISLIGGHPYLAQVALYHIARHNLTLEELLQTATHDSGPFGSHLNRYLKLLNRDQELRKAMALVVTNPKPVQLELDVANQLYSLGLVLIREKQKDIVVRCELYRLYFRDRLSSPYEGGLNNL